MDIWHYHPTTGRLLGAGVADPNPVEEGAWLVPAFAATVAPPAATEGHEIAWEAGAWVQREIPAPPPPPEPPEPPIITLTNRQLFAALALTSMITQAEALAAGRVGEVPAAIEAVFNTLPPDAAFMARLTWATMREVPRDHPLIAALVAAGTATAEQVDALFTLGSSLP